LPDILKGAMLSAEEFFAHNFAAGYAIFGAAASFCFDEHVNGSTQANSVYAAALGAAATIGSTEATLLYGGDTSSSNAHGAQIAFTNEGCASPSSPCVARSIHPD